MNILIIEDEYSLADAIAETLKNEKFNVCIKTNGEDGEDEALTIKLADNTENNLSDGGSSEYDGCIFSYGKLTIEGNGTLIVSNEKVTDETYSLYVNGEKV